MKREDITAGKNKTGSQEAICESQRAAITVVDTLPLVMRQLAAEMRRREYLPGEGNYHLLLLLRDRPHNLSELAQKHNVSLPTMSSTVSRLSERGLVERKRAEHDRRQLVIELTPAGHAVFDRIRLRSRQFIEELLKELPNAEIVKLIAGLEVLQEVFLSHHLVASAEEAETK